MGTTLRLFTVRDAGAWVSANVEVRTESSYWLPHYMMPEPLRIVLFSIIVHAFTTISL